MEATSPTGFCKGSAKREERLLPGQKGKFGLSLPFCPQSISGQCFDAVVCRKEKDSPVSFSFFSFIGLVTLVRGQGNKFSREERSF